MRRPFALALLLLLLPAALHASDNGERKTENGERISFGLGYNIGGTMPIPMPEAIRSVDAFRPGLAPVVWLRAGRTLADRWGVATGLRFGRKPLDVETTVQAYHMSIVQGNERFEGYFTGHVIQRADLWTLTVPLMAVWRLPTQKSEFEIHNSQFTVALGPYISWVVRGSFDGEAFDGYLRQGDPTGPRLTIGSDPGSRATYDFSDQVRPLQWGLALAAEYFPWRHVGLTAGIECGLSGLLRGGFRAVEQRLYPIYATLGAVYRP